MPIGFIICGLFLIYLFFNNDAQNRCVYIVSLAAIMAGFFVPSFRVGVYIINPILFFFPLVISIYFLSKLSPKNVFWLGIMVIVTLLEYVISVKIDNNISLNISYIFLIVLSVNACFMSKNGSLPFLIITVSLLEMISGVLVNYNEIDTILGGVESVNFVVLTMACYMILDFIFKGAWRARYEEVN